jgi:hypothetical protein
VSALEIPGLRDDAVQDYVRHLQGTVRSKRHKAEYEKAGNIVLEDLLDLDQVYRDYKPGFFIARDVKKAPAEQFIRDIPAVVDHQKANKSQVQKFGKD